MEKPRNIKITPVEETDLGVYVWRMPDGRWVGDDQDNYLSISAQKGDLKRIHQLTEAVRSYGINDGAPYFLPGRRKVTDDEYEEQRERLDAGLLPDEYDIPALIEELNQKRDH